MREGPDAPDLARPPAGVRLARATWDDLDRVVALYQQCERDRVGEVTVRPEDIRHRWLEHGGPGEDTLLVEDEGEALGSGLAPPPGSGLAPPLGSGLAPPLIAYAEFHEDTDPWSDGLDLYTEGRVRPDHTGRGLATFLMRRAEDRARRAVARTGDTDAVLRTTVADGDDRALAWHRRRGFVPVRHFLQMRLDLDTPPPAAVWPTGVALRTVGPDDIPVVWDVHQRAFADLPTSLPADLPTWRELRVERDPAFDPTLWFLATAEGDPVGVCLARAHTPEAAEVGDVRDLGVVPAWRRRGIALALLRTALDAFHRRGLTGAALEVDDVTLDGAVRLYRAAGMRIARRTDVLELPLPPPPGPATPPPRPGLPGRR